MGRRAFRGILLLRLFRELRCLGVEPKLTAGVAVEPKDLAGIFGKHRLFTGLLGHPKAGCNQGGQEIFGALAQLRGEASDLGSHAAASRLLEQQADRGQRGAGRRSSRRVFPGRFP